MNTHGMIMDEIYKQRRKKMVCCVCGIKGHEIIDGNRYCNKHAMQIRRYGKILEETIFDPNEIHTYEGEGYAEVLLKDKNFSVVGVSKVDLEDIEFVKKYKWGLGGDGYMTTRIDGGTRRYHRLIVDAPKGRVVDHMNGDPLDNRKSNLNITTQTVNARNRFDKSTTASGVKGVYKHWNRWYVRIGDKYGGIFKTLDEAIARRKELEVELNYNYKKDKMEELDERHIN